MADGIDFSLIGIDELRGRMEEVKQDVRLKGGRFALRKAANLVRDQAKANALKLNDPRTGRSIADNMAVRFSSRRFKRTGDVMFRVGVAQGAQLPTKGDQPGTGQGGPTPHWRLLEFGTEHMRAQPFMRKALADHINDATNEFINQYDKALTRALKRARKKTT
ncbi:HK97 gp10 family phage protein [Aestuariicella hydrocarbonica]|uniref:HK97 gp10 family phage protein n=1 Tax=Pseudomaricurvus hydrocarbonicus TaxID=1470433 RepID=A0A9E5JSJ0_9GAMM|nr:HK97-gp10 family putative phage morphogenesis protein [Aestuariicella hydrocarbonica]NHO64621.1 HK97 gp10 family phage protein [Aestuariicella hydrocarbonica]